MQWSIREAYVEIEQRLAPRWMRPLMNVIHFVVAVGQQSIRDQISVRAAMLSYWTMVALVPLLLLAFALSGAVGVADDAIRSLIYNSLLAGAIGGDVGEQIDAFLDQISLGGFGAIGALGIVVFGAQLYFMVEKVFNDIFYTQPKRDLFHRFTAFYATVTLAPLLIASGFVLTGTLTRTLGLAEVTFFDHLFAFLLPLIVTAIAMTGMMRYLPAAQVSWKAAIAGGITGALLFEAAKRGFGVYLLLLGTEDSMERLYGSLGLLPVFLIWLNILWTIVLLGVEVAYVVQHWNQIVEQQHRWVVDPHAEMRSPDAFFALAVMSIIADRFTRAEGPTSAEQIAAILKAPDRHIQSTLELLEVTRLIVETDEKSYLPGVPLETTRVGEVIHRWRQVTALRDLSDDYPSREVESAGIEALDALFDKPLSSLSEMRQVQALLSPGEVAASS
ncbi:MAG: YihY/virulence factor BrkB family protein [Myxococcota bacterium]